MWEGDLMQALCPLSCNSARTPHSDEHLLTWHTALCSLKMAWLAGVRKSRKRLLSRLSCPTVASNSPFSAAAFTSASLRYSKVPVHVTSNERAAVAAAAQGGPLARRVCELKGQQGRRSRDDPDAPALQLHLDGNAATQTEVRHQQAGPARGPVPCLAPCPARRWWRFQKPSGSPLGLKTM